MKKTAMLIKRGILMLLILTMAFGLIPVTVSADDAEIANRGTGVPITEIVMDIKAPVEGTEVIFTLEHLKVTTNTKPEVVLYSDSCVLKDSVQAVFVNAELPCWTDFKMDDTEDAAEESKSRDTQGLKGILQRISDMISLVTEKKTSSFIIQSGQTYYANMLLVPKAGYRFDPETMFTVIMNGEVWNMDDYGGGLLEMPLTKSYVLFLQVPLTAVSNVIDISRASVKGIENKVYTGKKQTQSAVLELDGTELTEGVDYTTSYANNKNAGTASVTFEGQGLYTGTITKTFTIKKAKQPMEVKGLKRTLKYNTLKKKNVVIRKSQAYEFTVKPKGDVTYTLDKAFKKYFAVDAGNGKITVKKGIPKGTYRVKVKIKAAGTDNYKSGSASVRVRVVVK